MTKPKRSYKGRKKKIDPVQVQVSIMVPRLRIKGRFVKIAPAVIQEAILQWADTGMAPDGFEIKGVEWENYGRSKERRYADDEASIEEARLTLKLGQLFRGRFVDFQPLRRRKGTPSGGYAATGFRPKTITTRPTTVGRNANNRPKAGVDKVRPDKKRVARRSKAKAKSRKR